MISELAGLDRLTDKVSEGLEELSRTALYPKRTFSQLSLPMLLIVPWTGRSCACAPSTHRYVSQGRR